jgi:coenzyme F420-reducing hydrogenase alpha subunit
MPGGFARIPDQSQIKPVIEQLKKIRPAVLRLIDIFLQAPLSLVRPTHYFALVSYPFSFLEGRLQDEEGEIVEESDYRKHLEHVVIPYSHASGYKYKGGQFRLGSLARLNLNKQALHADTRRDAAKAMEIFPSHDIFHNNVAQAIEILHSVDESIELLERTPFTAEKPQRLEMRSAEGIGVIEAPRGTLYHKLVVDDKGIVERGEVIVPTGQNQIAIEYDLKQYIQDHLDMPRETLSLECEKIIRAYDPCMSCGSHFLKLEISEA